MVVTPFRLGLMLFTHVRYTSSAVPAERLAGWEAAYAGGAERYGFALPPPNPFIPTDFSLRNSPAAPVGTGCGPPPPSGACTADGGATGSAAGSAPTSSPVLLRADARGQVFHSVGGGRSRRALSPSFGEVDL